MWYNSSVKSSDPVCWGTFKITNSVSLEPIIQSEVSQKDKDQYSILTYLYGILKDGNDNPICKTKRDTDVQNRLWDSVGEGEGGMF